MAIVIFLYALFYFFSSLLGSMGIFPIWKDDMPRPVDSHVQILNLWKASLHLMCRWCRVIRALARVKSVCQGQGYQAEIKDRCGLYGSCALVGRNVYPFENLCVYCHYNC